MFVFVLPSSYALDLVRDGASNAYVMISADASDYTKYAANELINHIELVTGVKLAIYTDGMMLKMPPGMVCVHVGLSKHTEALGIDAKSFKPDGFTIRSTSNEVVIAGRDLPSGVIPTYQQHPMRWQETWDKELKLSAFGEAGTIYAVYRFLEDFVGIRWYMPGELGRILPKSKNLSIADNIRLDVHPQNTYRYAWFCNFSEEKSRQDHIWYRRVGFGGIYPVAIMHNYVFMRKHRDSHPEYFALINGQRDFDKLSVIMGGGNFCLSNEGLMQEWVKTINAYFDKNPHLGMFPLCPNDGVVKICECEKCWDQYSRHLGEDGDMSNYVWNFTARVAREVAKTHPDKFIGTFAYARYRQPPDIEDFPQNIAVMICYARQSLRDATHKESYRTLTRGWAEKTKNLYFWTYPIYDYWMPYRGFPVFYPTMLQEDMQFHKQLGARGEFLESEFRMGTDPQVGYHHIAFPGIAHLNMYLRAKLLWNPDLDMQALLSEYYQLFYGPAQAKMREFWEYAETCYMRKQADNPAEIYSSDDITSLLDMLKDAQDMVPAGSDYAKRIQLIQNEATPFMTQVMNMAKGHQPFEIYECNDSYVADAEAPFWQNAKEYTLRTKLGTQAEEKTVVRGVAVKEGIAIKIECYDPDPSQIVKKSIERDGKVWEDDNLEFFFSEPEGKRCVQYIVNPAGTIWDGLHDITNKLPNSHDWDSKKFQAKATIDKDRWTVLVLVPWEDLKLIDGKLNMNIYRTYPREVKAVSAFAPNNAYHHRCPEFFAEIRIIK